jgi:hypothetical protein
MWIRTCVRACAREPRRTWLLHVSRLGKLRTDIAPDIDTFYLCDIQRRADVARRDRRFLFFLFLFLSNERSFFPTAR